MAPDIPLNFHKKLKIHQVFNKKWLCLRVTSAEIYKCVLLTSTLHDESKTFLFQFFFLKKKKLLTFDDLLQGETKNYKGIKANTIN